MKKTFASLFLAALCLPALAQMTPAGLWRSIDDNSGEAKADMPSGKVPVLWDHGEAIWDSMAILMYLADKAGHDRFWPRDMHARGLAYAMCAEMHSGFGQLRKVCPMSCGVRVKLHQPLPTGLLSDLQRLQTLWTQCLQTFGGPFLAGEKFTAVLCVESAQLCNGPHAWACSSCSLLL